MSFRENKEQYEAKLKKLESNQKRYQQKLSLSMKIVRQEEKFGELAQAYKVKPSVELRRKIVECWRRRRIDPDADARLPHLQLGTNPAKTMDREESELGQWDLGNWVNSASATTGGVYGALTSERIKMSG